MQQAQLKPAVQEALTIEPSKRDTKQQDAIANAYKA